MTGIPRCGPLRDPAFRRLWLADAVSQAGSWLGELPLTLLAIGVLHAGVFEVALLRALRTAGFLLLGLQVGVWCDRMRCRGVLVAADAGRAVLLGSVPLAAALGLLTLAQVYLVVAAAGVLTVFFDVGRRTYLPRLADREDLLAANAALEGNRSVAAVAGSGLGGYLVQWLGAPVAVLADAVSYLGSALLLARIRRPEPTPPRTERALLRDIRVGVRFVLRHPVLRAFGAYTATYTLFQSMFLAIGTVYLVRRIGLSAGSIGLLATVGLCGALAGAFLARRLARWVGPIRLVALTALICGIAYLGYPLTAPGWRLVCWAGASFVASAGVIVLSVVQVSVEQQLCPAELLGRANATLTLLQRAFIPVGSLLGGLLAAAYGYGTTLWVAAGGVLLSACWLARLSESSRGITRTYCDAERPQ